MLIDYKEDPFAQLMKEDGIQLDPIEIETLEKLSLKINQFKHNANELGCTKESSRLFLLKHIFCDTASKYQEMMYSD